MELAARRRWSSVQKVGGVSFFLAGILYLVNFGLFVSFGNLPTEGQALLRLVVDHRSTLQSIWVIFFVIDTLLIIGITALFSSLKHAGTRIMVGSVLAVVSLTVDLVNTILAYSLLGLSSSFAGATSEAQRTAYGAVGQLILILTLSVGTSFFIILFSISIVVLSIGAMATIGKAAGYLGIIAGILGIVGGVLQIIPLSVLWPVWFIVVGYRLYNSSPTG